LLESTPVASNCTEVDATNFMMAPSVSTRFCRAAKQCVKRRWRVACRPRWHRLTTVLFCLKSCTLG
uniref:Uncharacterized protein n=1 Tax=Hyaloperonospora arabidopsidis (strain Emoy2) TaxID=559515 RepID=M4C5F4_HYAAE